MAYCINNEDFLYITQTVSKTFSDTTGRYHYQLNNKNRILNPDEGIISGKQVSLTKPDTAMYVHTKTKTGHCVLPCLHVAGHQIRITNGVMPVIL